MKYSVLILSVLALLVAGCKDKNNNVEPAAKAIDTIPMLVTQVQQCSRLYTIEYQIHKIITHNDKMKVSGTFLKQDFSVNLPLGERSIAIPMDATLKAYIDMSNFSEKNIQRRGKELLVTLPDPKIILVSTKIDHKEIKENVPLTRRNFTDAELTNYEQQGRKQIIASIPQMGIIEQAQESATRQLVPIFTTMGYKESDVTISFRKKFTIKDLGSLFEVKAKD